MTRAAALAVVAVVFAAGCSSGEDAEDEAPPAARYVVYTKGVGLRSESIWIGDVEGRRMRRLTSGYGALVSPDGRSVAFHRCVGRFEDCQLGEGQTHVRVIGSDGANDRMVIDGAVADAWLPDSRHLLVRSGGALVRVDAEGGGRNTVVEKEDLLRGWSVGPDGRVAYAQARKENPWGVCREDTEVYVVEAGGTGRRRLTTGGRSSDPVWIGDRIAYARHPLRRRCVAPASGISTMLPDGSGKRDVVFPAPRRFAWNGYYGLRPFGRVRGRPLLLAGVRTEWGNELALVDVRSGRIRRADLDPRPRSRAPMYVGYVSRDGRHALGTGCGAEYPCEINLYSVLERRGRTIASGRVAGAHWNR